jgi:pimeloyl-ACP methyl ester carboxylesterase
VEQLTAAGKAAVDELVRRGVADPARVSVGGHSYGAFMTANLLAHLPGTFAAGIARRWGGFSLWVCFEGGGAASVVWLACPVAARLRPSTNTPAHTIARTSPPPRARRSGAYNRTLTPFGFQSEQRTLWQSPGVYARMSPFQ